MVGELDKYSTVSVVGKRGILTIPAKIREGLGIADGSPVKIEVDKGVIKIELIQGGK